jgi:hypothetical protein
MALATVNTIFPVYVYESGMDLPKEGTYYVVSGNGLWLHKDTGIVRSFTPVENISCLEDIAPEIEIECRLPKVPARLVWRIKEFFRRVVELHNSEAEVTLFFNKKTAEFRVHVPEQVVSHGSVRYHQQSFSHLEGMEDFLRVGTIHSHCNFDAFHSGTDEMDEKDFDGLHVTFGHNDLDEFSISASLVVNGRRKLVDPLSVAEGLLHKQRNFYRLDNEDFDRKTHEWAEGISEWMNNVRCNNFFSFSRIRNPDAITAGSLVVWRGDNSASSLKEAIGEGPFDVKMVEGDKIVILGKAGYASLSEKLFKKS